MTPTARTPLISESPDLGGASVALAGNSERTGRAFVVAVALSSLLVAGWACGAQVTDNRPSVARTPPRAEDAGGNPPSYEVFGKRYRVRASSDGYHARGIASWYGHPFDGRPTSSGETYDMNGMTAAHQTLPLPTWVEITNLTNGKRVVVKVNDRGPFVGRRLIDVSYAAARALDMVRDGTARVEVRALDGPPSRPPTRAPWAPAKSRPISPEPPAEPRLADSERLFAEAGRFKNREDAVELVHTLNAEGFLNAFVVTEDRRRKSLHRVRIGPLHDAAEVESISDRLRELGARHAHSVAMS
ncbi:MAG TPA: septal ring lytic transglycosylase RlpA family protein [Gammaproteobacteria bacterium]|nr:septal ring lytic transglycosylase RlpA family protein [Gammaproteobacteria bacterium]